MGEVVDSRRTPVVLVTGYHSLFPDSHVVTSIFYTFTCFVVDVEELDAYFEVEMMLGFHTP
jgi:hypothetical protein